MNFKYHFYIIVYSIVLLCTACKKEYSYEKTAAIQQPPPINIPTSSTEIITVGSLYNNSGGLTWTPIYWKNDSFFYVDPSSINTEEAIAFSVEKWNNNLIIVGSFLQNRWTPCYWVNGKKHILPFPAGVSALDYCEAMDIKICNNIIYILGQINGAGDFIWKISDINATPQIIRLKEPNNISVWNKELYATNIAVANNKIVVFGEYNAQFINGTKKQPCIWEIDALNNVTVSVPENNANTSFYITWGDASSNNTYMIGDDNYDNIFIWTKDKRIFTISKPGLIEGYRASFCKINDDGNLYLLYVQAENALPQPKLCIINPQGQIVKEENIVIPTNTYGYAFGIDIKNNEYALGIEYYNRMNNNYGFINKMNNNSIPLDFMNNILVYPRCTRIFPK